MNMDPYVKYPEQSVLSELREQTYIDLCVIAAQLRNRIYFNDQRYPLVQTSYEFRRLFDQLYGLVSDNKDVDNKLSKTIYKWLNAYNPAIDIGLQLFEKYKKYLIRYEIISGDSNPKKSPR